MIRKLVPSVLLLALWLAWAEAAEAPRGQGPAVQTTVEVLGPFALGGSPEQNLSVRATTESLRAPLAGGWNRTLTRYEVSDAHGRLLYLESLSTQLTPDRGFSEEVSLNAALVRGRDRRFLLVQIGVDPSAPGTGNSYHFFGFDRQGRFKRFGAPIAQEGGGLRNPWDLKQKVVDLIEGKYLEFSEWMGSFGLIVRRHFVESAERFELAGLCGPVEVDPRTPLEGSISLYASPGPAARRESVRVQAKSRIEFLEGCRGYGVKDPARYAPWLRIRIDGKEGWVPYEDTPTLGLPEAG